MFLFYTLFIYILINDAIKKNYPTIVLFNHEGIAVKIETMALTLNSETVKNNPTIVLFNHEHDEGIAIKIETMAPMLNSETVKCWLKD